MTLKMKLRSVLIQTRAMSTAWRRRWEGLCVRFVIACSMDVKFTIVIFDVVGSIVVSF